MTRSDNAQAVKGAGRSPGGSLLEGPPARPGDGTAAAASSDILPYALPIFIYVGLSALESYLPQLDGHPSPLWYPLAYAGKVVVTALVAWHYRYTWKDFLPVPSFRSVCLAVLAGLFVWLLWIGLDGLYPLLRFLGGARVAFDPMLMNPIARWAFIGVRLLGLVVLVPLIEELFWRSFLLRWLIDPEYSKVPVGRVTPMAAGVTSVLFALVHPEWLPALLTGLLWAGLLWRTRSLGACFISHLTANLALGVYVIGSGDWKYW
jgi:CAAX prenyl protease-like protein